jgi:hypothetical protein
MRRPFFSRIWMMPFTSVVLPVPGPPVMTSTLLVTALRMASRCSGASEIFCRSSNQVIALSTSMVMGRAAQERPAEFRGAALCPVQRREVDGPSASAWRHDDLPRLGQGPHRGLDDAGVDLQERRSGVDELLAWVEDVPLVR